MDIKNMSDRKFFLSIASFILTIIITFSSLVYWSTCIRKDVDFANEKITAIEENKADTKDIDNLNDKIESVRADVCEIKNGLSKIDSKIDKLIERD